LKIKKPLAALLCAAMLLTTGCRKGDGSDRMSKIVTYADADTQETSLTSVTADPDANNEKPFAFDASSLSRPKQDIVLALLYEKETEYRIDQAINYYDADGNVYRYNKPLDLSGDWFSELESDRKNGAAPVSKMNEAECETLWYLAAHAEEYEKMQMKRRVIDKNVQGTYQLYLIKPDGTPIKFAVYAKTSEYRYSAEVASFLNWFRFFYHSDYKFGE